MMNNERYISGLIEALSQSPYRDLAHSRLLERLDHDPALTEEQRVRIKAALDELTI